MMKLKSSVLFLLIFCFAQTLKADTLASIISQIPATQRMLVSGSYFDYSTFDNSAGTIPMDSSLLALTEVQDRLIMGLYKSHSSLLSQYIFDPPDFQTKPVSITINPCTSLKYLDKCQEEIEVNLIKHIRVPPLEDILIMLEVTDYLFDCQNNYVTMDLCGTFLEIHRPLDETVISSLRIDSVLGQSPVFEYLTIKSLCAGKYEIWLVFRSQIGFIIHFIKPFFVEGPSCSCSTITSNGYTC